MNKYYAQAIELIGMENLDWKQIGINIAKKHPKIFVEGSHNQFLYPFPTKTFNSISEAIKRYRAKTGMGLKESKDYVESL